jgi:hypothetical protein
MIPANDIGRTPPDPELQPILAMEALQGLDRLLTGTRPSDTIEARQIAAIVRLIVQAAGSA